MMDVLMADDDGVEIKRDVSKYGDEHLADNCVELMRWILSVVTASTERRFFRSCNNIMKYINLKINIMKYKYLKINITLSKITICIKPFSNQNWHVNAIRVHNRTMLCSIWSFSISRSIQIVLSGCVFRKSLRMLFFNCFVRTVFANSEVHVPECLKQGYIFSRWRLQNSAQAKFYLEDFTSPLKLVER